MACCMHRVPASALVRRTPYTGLDHPAGRPFLTAAHSAWLVTAVLLASILHATGVAMASTGEAEPCRKSHGQCHLSQDALSQHSNLRVDAGINTRMESSSSTATAPATEWVQKQFSLPAYPRGCHVITKHIYKNVPEISQFEVGLANIFLMHTSASLTINENASPDVPPDLNDVLDRIVPESAKYRHDDEGSDDMPAHGKSSLMGVSHCIPIAHGRLALGTWQGIYLNEHRNYGGARTLTVTLQGRKRADGRSYPAP